MVEMTKENARTIANYFKKKYDELMVAKEDYETFIEWTKDPSSDPNKEINGEIMEDVFGWDCKSDRIMYFKRMLRENELELEIIKPLYEITSFFA